MHSFAGKVCLLTGASRGMGRQFALRLAQEGLHMALVARSAEPLEELAAEIARQGGTARAFPCDVTDRAALEALVSAVRSELGPVAVLVNNAGIDAFRRFHSAPLDEISLAVRLNVEAPLMLTRMVLPDMLAQGQGQIVSMASVAGLAGTPYGAVYSATKAALVAATNSLRQEYPDGPVGFSALCPGFVHGAGMHEEHKRLVGRAPAVLGGTTVDAVTDALVRAIRDNPAELIVNSSPLRPMIGLARTFPGLANRVVRWMSGAYMEALVDAKS